MLQLDGPARISSFCSADKPQCVKVRFVRVMRANKLAQALLGWKTVILMTDTKLGAKSPVVKFDEKRWKRFCENVDAWVPAADGQYRVVDLAFTEDEYEAFCKGVNSGEFEVTYQPDEVYA